MNIQVKVENASPITKKLTVKIPSDSVKQRLEQSFAQVQKKAQVKGFRVGQVPMTMVRQMYGNDVRHSLYHDLIQESYRQAVNQEKLRAIGSPKIQGENDHHNHQLDESQDLTYTAEVEIIPEIKIKNYKGLSLKKESTDVSADDVKKQIDAILDEQSSLEPIADTTAKATKGHYVDIEFNGGLLTDKGLEPQAGMSGTRVLELGSGQFIEGFEENIEGLTAGSSKTFDITFPQDYFEKSLAGQKAQFTVKLNELKKKVTPEVTDELVKKAGFESVEQMNQQVKESIQKQKEQFSERKLKSDLVDAILKENTFEVPGALVQAQTRTLLQNVAQNLKQQGFTDTMVQEALAQEFPKLNARALQQVKASLVFESVARQEKIELESADIDRETAKIAEATKLPLEKVREFYLNQPNEREEFEYKLKEDKTVQYLIGQTKLK